MLFWPLAIVSFVSLALFLTGPPEQGFVGTEDAGRRMVFLIVFACGLTIAGAGRLLLRGGPATARVAVVWVALFVSVVFSYSNRVELSDLYDRLRGNIHPSVALTTAQGEAELRRAWDGHYRAEADVNGVSMRLMVDTGASMVLIPYEVAGELGLDPDNLDFTVPVTTANGSSTVAAVRISSIKIGPIAVFDVQAAVAHPGMLKVGLLGMSFLEKLEETSFRGDKLLMRN
ncbi:MAG: TIGR02281 family clan AA aspartic protease [Paracoccaceae bacterium]